MAFDEVNEDNVYICVGHPLRRDIENIVNWMLNDNFTKAYNSILNSLGYKLKLNDKKKIKGGTFLYQCILPQTILLGVFMPATEKQNSSSFIRILKQQTYFN